MNKIPESYYFYQEHIRHAKLEKAKLKKEYEKKINELNNEITYLRTQIDEQHEMISKSVEFAMKLEEQINSMGSQLSKNPANTDIRI